MGRLAETISSDVRSGRTYTCKVATVCEDDADRAAVADLMANPNLSIRAIGRELGVSEGVVFKHRSKECVCFRG